MARGIGGGGIGISRGIGSGVAVRSFGGAQTMGVPGHFAGRSFAPAVRNVPNIGARTIGVPGQFAGRSFAPAVSHVGVGNRFTAAAATGTQLSNLHAGNLNALRTGNLQTTGLHAANIAHTRALFGNRTIANPALGHFAMRSGFGPARFHGRFFGSHWPWWRGGAVIGWVGPLFWPFAYYDFFDYVFWPYAYDDFWPYAYNDVYYGIYGNYAYTGTAPGSAPGAGAGAARGPVVVHGDNRGVVVQRRPAAVCSDQAAELADWPLDRIAEVVQPTDEQRGVFDEFKSASAKAIDILKSACPNDLPSIPTG